MGNKITRRERYERIYTACEPLRNAKKDTIHTLAGLGRKHKLFRYPILLVLTVFIFFYNIFFYVFLGLKLEKKLARGLAVVMTMVLVITSVDITALALADNSEQVQESVVIGDGSGSVSSGDVSGWNSVSSGDESAIEEQPETELSEELRALQERIHSLPSGEAYRNMSIEEQDAVYEEAAALSEEYFALTEEDQAKLDITKLEELFAVMNEGIGAYSVVTFLNSGYPYGKNMSGSAITLVIETEGLATSYQWQVADSQSGSFSNISGANSATYSFTPTSGYWYRCMVDGTPSEAVMAVYPGQDGRSWTNPYTSWYISNGTMAYMVNSTSFDAVGLYEKNDTEYMLCTSYGRCWKLFSSTLAEPTSGTSTSASLDALRVSFDERDAYNIIFEADLTDGQQAFAFGCDTQLGNSNTSGDYSDWAALNAMVKNGVLQQVAMIGAATVKGAADDDPAFVIAPVDPASRFWIGKYSSRQTYAYNTSGGSATETIDGQSVVTLLEGVDSGMTMSWMNIPSGGSVRFRFSVGDVAHTGAISGKVDYEKEMLTGLDPGVTYIITSDNSTFYVIADENGEIPLSGTDQNGNSYDLTGKRITIAKQGSSDTPAEIEVVDRPSTPDTPSDLEEKEDENTNPIVDANIEIVELTPNSVIISPKEGQQYAYSADGTNWVTLTELNENGYYVITGLPEGATMKIRTRIAATSETPASQWSDPKEVTLKRTVTATATGWNDIYDGDVHGITVDVNSPTEGIVITYSGTETGNYSSVKPLFDAVGEYIVYYRVTADGYYPAYGSATVTINPLTAELSWGETAFTYNGSVQVPVVTVSNLIAGDSCTVTVAGGQKDTNAKTATTAYTATVASLSNSNYKLPETGTTKPFTIAQREVSVGWTNTQFTYDGYAHKPEASLSNVLTEDTCNVTVSGEQTDANIEGSTYTASATIDSLNYRIKSGDETTTFTISNASQTAPSLTPVNETIRNKADGQITGLTTAMEYRKEGESDYTAIINADMTFASGTYFVRYAAKTNYDASPETRAVIGEGRKLLVSIPTAQTGYTLTVSANERNWHESVTLTYTLKEGYSETAAFAIQVNGTVLTAGTNGTYTYTINNIETDQTITVVGVVDITAPTGEITIANNEWNRFLNTITFGLFFKETKEVEITASDAGSGLQSISYYVSEEELNAETVQSVTEWESYTEKFSIDPNHGYIVYAKLTDNTGNIAYLSSDGIVLYTDAAQDTQAISFTKASGEDKTASVTLNGNTIKAISDGAKTLVAGTDYTISGNVITLKNSYLQSLTAADIPYVLTISYNPLGKEYQEKVGVDGTDQNDAPKTTEIQLIVTKETARITDVSSVDKTYDASPVAMPFYTDNFDEAVKVEYKVKGADDSTYTMQPPKDAGTYTVRLSAPADENYTAVTETRDFTIAQKEITAIVKAADKVYDGNATAEVTATVETGVEGQTLTISDLTGSFGDADGNPDKNIGYDKTVIVDTVAVDVTAGEADTRVSNYKIIYTATVKASITAKPIIVTAKDAEKTYGDEDPELSYFISKDTPLVTGESLVKISVTREVGENVGTYVMTATQAEEANSNYAITFQPGTFTINKAVLTIVPKPEQEKTYGEKDSVLGYVVEGLKNGEKREEVLEGELSREEGENAGVYSYQADTLTDKTGNYEIRLTEGSDISAFTVTKKKLTENMVWVSAEKDEDGVRVIVKDEVFGEESVLTEGIDYIITVTKEEGVYVVVISGKGNYQESITKKVENPTWNGSIATTVVVDSSVEEVKPSLEAVKEDDAKSTLMNLIKDPEVKEKVESGTGADYYALLYIEIRNAQDVVTAEDKQLITDKIEEVKDIPSDATVGMYLDLSLYMTYSVTDGTNVLESGTERITDTSDEALGDGKGYSQIVTVTVPEELRPKEANIRRNYYIIRVHDDGINGPIVEQLEVTQNGYILTFETDKFSTYALAYSDEIMPIAVTLDVHESTITTGGTLQLSATVVPEDATNKKVMWTSSDLNVATVDQNGKVTAVGSGTCVITVTTEEGGKTDTCTIKVETPSKPDNENNQKEVTSNSPDTLQESKSADTDVVKTGDNSNMALWIILVLIIAGAFVGIGIFRKRRKDTDEK